MTHHFGLKVPNGNRVFGKARGVVSVQECQQRYVNIDEVDGLGHLCLYI